MTFVKIFVAVYVAVATVIAAGKANAISIQKPDRECYGFWNAVTDHATSDEMRLIAMQHKVLTRKFYSVGQAYMNDVSETYRRVWSSKYATLDFEQRRDGCEKVSAINNAAILERERQ